MNAEWIPAIIMFSSLRGSPMIAELLGLLGRSSCVPSGVLPINSLMRFDWYSCGETEGPPPYMASRSNTGVRLLRDVVGSVGVPSFDVVSKVTSWSMNWPMKVVPAVWGGLLGLCADLLGSVMRRTGPAARASWASG